MNKRKIMDGFSFAIGYTIGIALLKGISEKIVTSCGYEIKKVEVVKKEAE